MFVWLIENLGTILVTLLLIVIVTMIILYLIREKKQGRSSCGGNCGHCSMCGTCHQKPEGSRRSLKQMGDIM